MPLIRQTINFSCEKISFAITKFGSALILTSEITRILQKILNIYGLKLQSYKKILYEKVEKLKLKITQVVLFNVRKIYFIKLGK